MVVGSDDTGARSSNICLSAARGIHPAPLARPFSKGLRDCGCHILDFIRLGGIHLAPMARPLSRGPWDLEWLIFAFRLLRVNFQTLNQPNCQR